MAKRFEKRQLSESDMPVSSFSDIAFLLIIFFILTTTFQKATGFLADIPAGAKGEAQEQSVTISLHDDKVTLNDDGVSMAELRRRLNDLNLHEKAGDAKMVVLTASGKVNYQNYFEAMAMVNTAGGVVVIERENVAKGGSR